MATGSEKVVQYLDEAHATEEALVRTLQAHISMTPKGEYRDALERHLRETEGHRDRVLRRLDELGEGRTVVEMGVGAFQTAVGQVVAMSKLPLDLFRGETGEEKLLKNAKDECATEALEIATYRSLEALANHVGDTKTAELAVGIRADEERMLAQLQELLPPLTEAAAKAEIVQRSYDASTTGAADAARDTTQRGRQQVLAAQQRVVETAREAVERVGEVTRDAISQLIEAAQRGEATLEATSRAATSAVRETSEQAESAVRETAEAAREGAEQTAGEAKEEAQRTRRTAQRGASRTRGTARGSARGSGRGGSRGGSSRSSGSSGSGDGNQPWSGYDAQGVAEINRRLSGADGELARKVRDYERGHKNRSTIVRAADRKAR